MAAVMLTTAVDGLEAVLSFDESLVSKICHEHMQMCLRLQW